MLAADMKRATKTGVDRLSELPECIVHEIMFHLPAEDILKTTYLSKRWYSINKSYPVLDFDQQNYGRNFKEVVYNSLRHFSQNKLSLNSFRVFIRDTEISSLFTHLDSWIQLALENKVKELVILLYKPYTLTQQVFSSKTLTLLELSSCFLDQPLSVFSSLKKLVLRECHIKGPIILKHGDCPLLEDLDLTDCYGFRYVHISDLLRLRTVEIDMDIDIDKTADEFFVASQSIQKFSIRVHPRRPWSEFINIAGCHHLKFLHLQSQKITDQEFHSLLLQLPLLEELYLFNCHSLRRINISSSPRLKTLQVCPEFDYSCLEMIEIAAPSLKNFIFIAEKNYEIKVANCCCGLKTLVLLNATITNNAFDELLSKFPQLENLWIIGCEKLQQMIKIPNLQLKRLHITRCFELKVVEVCSPNLRELHYTGDEAPEFFVHTHQNGNWTFERDQTHNGWWYSMLQNMLSTIVGIKDEVLVEIIRFSLE